MKQKYPEYKQLDLTQIGKEVRDYWKGHGTFEKSVELRKGHKPFVFYEGPPVSQWNPWHSSPDGKGDKRYLLPV